MPETFTFAAGIQLVALILTGMTALLGVWWKIEVRIRDVENKAKHDLRNLEHVSAEKRSQIDKDLQAFKLHVAEKYASYEAVKEGERLLADRIERLATQVSEMPDVVVERITKFMLMRPQA